MAVVPLRHPVRMLLVVVLLTVLAAVAWLWKPAYDPGGCSIAWKGRIVREKLAGNLSYVGWRDIAYAVVQPCYDRLDPNPLKRVSRLAQKTSDGRTLVEYRTDLGDFWLPRAERGLLAFLVWEITVQRDYEGRAAAVDPGDFVVDCGAHVGVFSRYALRRGAQHLVAIEPDPLNLECLRMNLASEIAAGRVDVVAAGVWSSRSELPLYQSPENSGGSSFVSQAPTNTEKTESLSLFPLDEIVQQLKLPRVDFIKMDIEGAERYALRGSTETIRQFHPRMAICTYHLADDVKLIPAIVKEADPTYDIQAKDLYIMDGRVNTKVLFFH